MSNSTSTSAAAGEDKATRNLTVALIVVAVVIVVILIAAVGVAVVMVTKRRKVKEKERKIVEALDGDMSSSVETESDLVKRQKKEYSSSVYNQEECSRSGYRCEDGLEKEEGHEEEQEDGMDEVYPTPTYEKGKQREPSAPACISADGIEFIID